MDTSKLTAREALDELPMQLAVARGAIRIQAHFHDGQLADLRVTVFKVPPHAIHTVVAGHLEPELLEHVARELHLDTGDTQLVAEYDLGANDQHPRLRCVDFGWHQ